MLSLRQRLINVHCRWLQRTALMLVRPPWLARRMFTLNALTLYKRPKGLRTTPMSGQMTLCACDNLPTYGTLLYIHGGAFVIGSLPGYSHLVGTLARDTRMRGVFVNYRMAPEHPFPAALDDATAAYETLLADPDSGPIAIAGDSAGGNITLALLHRILARGLPLPYAVAALSPVTDLSFGNPSLMANLKSDLLVPPSWGLRGAGQYKGTASATDPELSPIHGTFSGSPPVLLHVDTTEVLYDDSRLMAQELRRQSVDVELRETTGLPHVNPLHLGRTPEADAAVAHIADFLNRRRPAPLDTAAPPA